MRKTTNDICNRIRIRALTEHPDDINDVTWDVDRGLDGSATIQFWFHFTDELDEGEHLTDLTDSLAAICDEELGDAYSYEDWDGTAGCFTIWYVKN